MHYMFLIILLIISIISLIIALVFQRNKYTRRIEYHKKRQEEQREEFDNKNSMYIKEIKQLKEQINRREEDEYEKLHGYDVVEGIIEKDPIYAGKKALIGDYMASSYNISKKVLKSLGFEVDVVRNKEDVINKIKNENNYDIIFSNNVYPDGSGPDCLKELKKIKGFSTPVVIHTITQDAREYFVDNIGFDEYIAKPLNQMKVKKALENIFKTK